MLHEIKQRNIQTTYTEIAGLKPPIAQFFRKGGRIFWCPLGEEIDAAILSKPQLPDDAGNILARENSLTFFRNNTETPNLSARSQTITIARIIADEKSIRIISADTSERLNK